MNKLHVKYLIIGGGAAGAAAAEGVRSIDSQGEVLLISQESSRPYHRALLANAGLRDRLPRAAMFTHDPEWFRANHIELRTGRRATQLDAARHLVFLDDGQEITFDRLLLATGAAAKHLTIPGKDLPALHYLRTYEDLERLRHTIDNAKLHGLRHVRSGTASGSANRGRAVVVGSGLLGSELAVSLTALGIEVDLLVKGQTPWTKFAGEAAGKWAARTLERGGVSVHTLAAPARLEGDGRVQRAILPSGEAIACDFVVAAVGVAANRDLLRGTPIAAERAILTDAYCRTSAEDIYAAGDCAAVFDPLFSKHRALEHFESATATGMLAGRNMAGANEAYDAVNHYKSEVFRQTLSVWGEARHVHHRLVRGAPAADDAPFVELGLTADDRISQVVAVNVAAADIEALRELVKQRVSVAGREEVFKDPNKPWNELAGM